MVEETVKKILPSSLFTTPTTTTDSKLNLKNNIGVSKVKIKKAKTGTDESGGKLQAPGSNIIHQKETAGFRNIGRKKGGFVMPKHDHNNLRTSSITLQTGRPGTDYLAKNEYKNWKKMEKNGKSIWYNVKTNKKQLTTPRVVLEYRKRVSGRNLNFNKT